jgi:hypothetical protein
MTVMKKHTFFSKSSGLEVRLGRRLSPKNGYAQGRIFLRAFPLEQGAREKQVTMMLNPVEAIKVGLDISKLMKSKETVQSLIHKYTDTQGNENTTMLSLDYWERDGKSGTGITLSRNKDKRVSIALRPLDFYLLQNILKSWAVESCYEEKVSDSEEGEEEETLPQSGMEEKVEGEEVGDDDIPF